MPRLAKSPSTIAGHLFGVQQGFDLVLPPCAAERERPPAFGEAEG